MKNINLYTWGLTDLIINESKEKYDRYFLGRVIEEHRNIYKIITENGKISGRVSGKILYSANGRVDYPAVGDWVAIDRLDDKEGIAIIEGILTRKSKFSRKIAGKTNEEQIIAANIDILFICMAVNSDFNLQRLERYISLAWNSGAIPVVLLTKCDLCDDIEEKIRMTSEVALGVDILAISVVNGTGLEDIEKYLVVGKTVSFVGSSGVGKSTIVNYLLGLERQEIGEIRKDGKGRHTTTYRELMRIPNGGIVIDTPGMREIHLLDDVEGIESFFGDIEQLARNCRFSDCKHGNEPGCAVRKAIENGELSDRRFLSYLKLKKEAEYMERKVNQKANIAYKKKIARQGRIRRDMFYRK